MTPTIERASSIDLMELATDPGGASMNVGAVLVLQRELDFARLSEVIRTRLGSIARLRQRLVTPPSGFGRPLWVDDARFDSDRHLRVIRAAPPGDERALLDVAADVVDTVLPAEHPRWSITYVTGLVDGTAALIFVFHHVLADGIGGLAILAALVDGAVATAPVDPVDASFPRRAPTDRELFVDAWRGRARALSRIPGLRALRAAVSELSPPPRRGGRRPVTLNRRIGPRRRFTVLRAPLDAVHAIAHAAQATVNDAVLAAIGGAIGGVLAQRGDAVEEIVTSVPVSSRATSSAGLGNAVGVFPVALPTRGDIHARMRDIARATRERRSGARASSALILAPFMRALAQVRLLHALIDRQRAVNTFVTNVRGPARKLSFLDIDVERLLPLGSLAGNVTVGFAILSYAGELAITIVVDPDAWPDLATLVENLRRELRALLRPPSDFFADAGATAVAGASP